MRRLRGIGVLAKIAPPEIGLGMARKIGAACTVCQSEHKHAIEAGAVAGVSARVLAAKYSVDRSAIQRHCKRHLTSAQRAALIAHVKPTAIDAATLREQQESSLLASYVAQRVRLAADADAARQFGDMRAVAAFERAITGNLDSVGKIVGMLNVNHNVRHSGSIEILTSQTWLRIVETIRGVLADTPEMLVRVAAALNALEIEAVDQVNTARKRPVLIEHEPQQQAAPTLQPPLY